MSEEIYEAEQAPIEESKVVNTKIAIAGTEYELVKTGRAQASQVLGLTRWITKHGKKASGAFNSDLLSIGASSGIAFLGEFVSNLDEDALIDLFVVIIGCPKEIAEVYFDIADLVNAALIVYDNQPTIKRLLERFFSDTNSKESMDENSMKSE